MRAKPSIYSMYSDGIRNKVIIVANKIPKISEMAIGITA